MITYQRLKAEQAQKLKEIDRSEHIDLIYEMDRDHLIEIYANHECPNWDKVLLQEIEQRYLFELHNGGAAIGSFDGERLIGFGVLAHQFRGKNRNQLQVDLMYVSRKYRRQGVGTRILQDLADEARARGAKTLYISSTETRSAVSFYKSNGSIITDELDRELFDKEPKDIHMVIQL